MAKPLKKGTKVFFTTYGRGVEVERAGKLLEDLPESGRFGVECDGATYRPHASRVERA